MTSRHLLPSLALLALAACGASTPSGSSGTTTTASGAGTSGATSTTGAGTSRTTTGVGSGTGSSGSASGTSSGTGTSTSASGSTGTTGTTTGTAGTTGAAGPLELCSLGSGPFPTYTIDQTLAVGLGAGDFDGDGHVDLMATGQVGSDLAYFPFWGDGAGAFDAGAPVSFASGAGGAGPGPGPLAVADLNGDGWPDLVACNQVQSVSVMLNIGGGAFAGPVTYPVSCYGLTAVDLGRNGVLDLAVVEGSAAALPDGGLAGTLLVMLNDGGGNFPTSLAFSASGPQSGVAAGDFNGDGWPDLATVGTSGLLEIYTGNGGSGLSGPTDYPGSPGLYADVVGDFDGDGLLDVAATSTEAGGSQVLVFHNVDGGAFAAPVAQQSHCNPQGLTAADFDNDGKMDVAVAGTLGLEIWLQVDGGLARPKGVYGASSNDRPVAADFNGDGQRDVAVVDLSSNGSALTTVANSCDAFDCADSGCPCRLPGLLAFYPFQGDTLDRSGGAHGIQASGVADAAGVFGGGGGGAYAFDGGSSAMHITGAQPLSGARSFCAWIDPATATGLGQPVFGAGVSGAGDLYGVQSSTPQGDCSAAPADNLYLDNWGTTCAVPSGVTAPAGAWSFVCYVDDGGATAFYANGAAGAAGVGAYNYDLATLTVGSNAIGGTTTQASFNGLVGQVTVWDRALSASEVGVLYGDGGGCRVP